mmetsp:Transcript_4452/g.6004  ORF Transcript_4452/g.6004 Transcript_4452/m.6004 type:complete len:262 (-) Transcript_4452:224-1009(-)
MKCIFTIFILLLPLVFASGNIQKGDGPSESDSQGVGMRTTRSRLPNEPKESEAVLLSQNRLKTRLLSRLPSDHPSQMQVHQSADRPRDPSLGHLSYQDPTIVDQSFLTGQVQGLDYVDREGEGKGIRTRRILEDQPLGLHSKQRLHELLISGLSDNQPSRLSIYKSNPMSIDQQITVEDKPHAAMGGFGSGAIAFMIVVLMLGVVGGVGFVIWLKNQSSKAAPQTKISGNSKAPTRTTNFNEKLSAILENLKSIRDSRGVK